MDCSGGIKRCFNKETEERIKNRSLNLTQKCDLNVSFFSWSVFLHCFLHVLHMPVCEFGENSTPSMKTFRVYSRVKFWFPQLGIFSRFCWKNLYALNTKMNENTDAETDSFNTFFFSLFFTCKEPYLMKFSLQYSGNCLHFLTIFVCRWKIRGGWCKCKVSADSAMEKERKEGEIEMKSQLQKWNI